MANYQPLPTGNPLPATTIFPSVPHATPSISPYTSPQLEWSPSLGYHFPYPGSLQPIPQDVRNGLVALAVVASASLVLGGGLLVYLTHRAITLRSSPGKLHRNHYIILIYNLLIADTLQAVGFLISLNWLRLDAIVAPTAACVAQGFLIQIGDVSSAIFVLLIAIFTFVTIVKEVKVRHAVFMSVVTGGWVLAVGLSVFSPAMHGRDTFQAAGAWCWIPQAREKERLGLHYFWIFLAEFLTLALYIYLFAFLYRRMSTLARTIRRSTLTSPTAEDVISQLYKAARCMLIYPLVYIVLTLPLSIGRMLNMQGVDPPLPVWCAMGSLMTSAGWVDAMVYSLTRGVLVSKSGNNGIGRSESAQSLTRYRGANASRPALYDDTASDRIDDFGLPSPKPRDSFMTIRGGRPADQQSQYGRGSQDQVAGVIHVTPVGKSMGGV